MSIGQGTVAVLFNWEGNRRCGVAPLMRHSLLGIFIYGLGGPRKGDEHHAYAPLGVWLLRLFS